MDHEVSCWVHERIGADWTELCKVLATTLRLPKISVYIATTRSEMMENQR